MKIELSEDEARGLLQLLDIATKAEGLNVAMAAVVFAERIKKAAAEPKDEKRPVGRPRKVIEDKPKLAAVE